MSFEKVLHFWFEEIESKFWFVKDLAFDQEIKKRFFNLHQQATCGELFDWRSSAEGRLAEIILLDQFSRNMFRDQPEAFASDSLALVLAQEAVRFKEDQKLDIKKRSFLYMPYMHSESKLIHERAVRLFSIPGLEGNLKFELLHKNIIDRFGRYPHRNAVLGRASTSEEEAFLLELGSHF